MAKIVDVEGIGTKYADKLSKAGVSSTDALLKAGATPKGRKELAEKTGIGDALILTMGQPCGFVPHQGRRF